MCRPRCRDLPLCMNGFVYVRMHGGFLLGLSLASLRLSSTSLIFSSASLRHLFRLLRVIFGRLPFHFSSCSVITRMKLNPSTRHSPWPRIKLFCGLLRLLESFLRLVFGFSRGCFALSSIGFPSLLFIFCYQPHEA